ncbi:hypothetical protein L1987_43602 [Smallanthus sonchifolius]|uniref:Uncharacterized protein n=1 Tax=Smallanthus sonchifolius TaxID=185202 RepID=A0ACB9GN58_9ASTR|nr:hypothetical protein L1987_43602 [Smallanthus sonchifolius]
MYSSNTQPSFSSSGTNGNIMQAAEDAGDQPPSYGAMGHGQADSYNKLHDQITYSEVDPTDSTNAPSFPALGHGQGDSYGINSLGIDATESTKAPSFPALGHGHGNSYNQDGVVYGDNDEKAPSIGTAMAKGGVSQTSEVLEPDHTDVEAPNLSDVKRPETSQTGTSSVVFDGPDENEVEGNSVVRKNFRRLYPNAYYKGKDDEDENEVEEGLVEDLEAPE